MSSLEKFISIKSIVDSLSSATKIIVVTKNFNFEQIKSIIDFGHTEFGENKVQEAKYKWNDYLINSPINLHLIGRLQSNKSKEAVQIFNYIHSLDSLKLAKELSKKVLELNNNIPMAYNKPEIKSRIAVLICKINSLNLFINLDEIPDDKVVALIIEINIELISLQKQLDEIVRKSTIPREEGESDLIQMLDTSRAIPTR